MRINEASSLFWLVFGVVGAYFSIALGLGSLTHIGPGFIPFWSGVFLVVLSLSTFLEARRATSEDMMKGIAGLWTGSNWAKPALVVSILLVYVLTYTYVGFVISTAIFLFVVLRVVDPVKTWVALIVATAGSFFAFVLFDLWLQVQLPHWILETFLSNVKRAIL